MQFLGGLLVLLIAGKFLLEYAGYIIAFVLFIYFMSHIINNKNKPNNNMTNSNLYSLTNRHLYSPNYVKRTDIVPMHDDSSGWDNHTPTFVKYQGLASHKTSLWGTCKTFTVIDFETANAYSDSVCQIGIARVENNILTESFSYYIKPPYKTIRDSNFQIHGIDWTILQNAKYFDELWIELKPYIQGQYIAAYNADFDIGCLESLFKCYNINDVPYAVFDILDTAKRNWPDCTRHKLETITKYLDIPLNPHKADSDATAAALLQIKANETDAMVYLYGMRTEKAPPSSPCYLFMSDWYAYDKASKLFDDIKNGHTADCATILPLLDRIINYSADPKHLAKAYRLYGEICEFYEQPENALIYYKKALDHNDKVGVKRKIKIIENKLAIDNMKIIASQIKK